MSGQRPTLALGFLRLAYLIVAGVLAGLVVGEFAHQIERLASTMLRLKSR